MNQLVRWVDNKEIHADELSEIVTYYFMTQRIKPPAADADDAAKAKYQKEIGLPERVGEGVEWRGGRPSHKQPQHCHQDSH